MKEETIKNSIDSFESFGDLILRGDYEGFQKALDQLLQELSEDE